MYMNFQFRLRSTFRYVKLLQLELNLVKIPCAVLSEVMKE